MRVTRVAFRTPIIAYAIIDTFEPVSEVVKMLDQFAGGSEHLKPQLLLMLPSALRGSKPCSEKRCRNGEKKSDELNNGQPEALDPGLNQFGVPSF